MLHHFNLTVAWYDPYSLPLVSQRIILIFYRFQIGRSSESPIDFVIMDTMAGEKSGEGKPLASTISRFACRILCERENPSIARIYAAGFDSSRNIFLGVSNFSVHF